MNKPEESQSTTRGKSFMSDARAMRSWTRCRNTGISRCPKASSKLPR